MVRRRTGDRLQRLYRQTLVRGVAALFGAHNVEQWMFGRALFVALSPGLPDAAGIPADHGLAGFTVERFLKLGGV